MNNSPAIYVNISNVGPQGASGAASITPVTAISTYTAITLSAPAIFAIYNTSGEDFTFNLPGAPGLNQQVQIIDAGLNAGTYAIAVEGNGNSIIANGASGSSVELVSNGASIGLAWDGTNWVQNA